MTDEDFEVVTGCVVAHPNQRGGQHVGNCTAVMIIHKPTGIGVRVSSERSQHGNRVLAMRRVRLLVELHESMLDQSISTHEDTCRCEWCKVHA